jgi:hypothetical protein
MTARPTAKAEGWPNARFPPLQLTNRANVRKRGPNIDGDSQRDHRRTNPRRDTVAAEFRFGRAESQRLKEQAETRRDEAKCHQRQACSNPGKKGSFRGEVIS